MLLTSIALAQNASKEVSREIKDFTNLVARCNKQIADLQNPWHLDNDNTFLDWLLLGRWTRYACCELNPRLPLYSHFNSICLNSC